MESGDDWQSGKTLAESVKVMFLREIATDTTFVFPGRVAKVKAHKVILMARSHAFFQLFTKQQEMPKKIEIRGVEPEIFKEFLMFLYGEEIRLSFENSLHLMLLAQKYKVDVLKRMCLSFLQENLTEFTVGVILDHAIAYNSELMHTCLTFLSNGGLGGLRHHHVTLDTLTAIVSFETLSVSEVEIFKACDAWAKTECNHKGYVINMENKRKVLGTTMKKIRFCSMSNNEFAAEVSGKEILTAEEELEIFRFLSKLPTSPAPSPYKGRMAVYAKLPADLIGEYSHTNPAFQIRITCARQFTFLGLIFTQAGQFNIHINDDTDEVFHVAETDVNNSRIVYLSKSAVCKVQTGLDIRSQKSKFVSRSKLVKTYAFSAVISRKDNITIKFYITPYNYSPPPFDTLLFAL